MIAVAVAAAEEWRAPPRAAAKGNPVLADAASIKRGKAVYSRPAPTKHTAIYCPIKKIKHIRNAD
jgi:hypothetical protein